MTAFELVPQWLWVFAAMIMGMLFGSFSNVCIARMPKKESVAFPPSNCPKCNTPISAIDNIPVFSYLFLGGKCRACKESISIQYPIVETVTGLLMAGVVWKFGATIESVLHLIIMPPLVIITMIDIEHQIIPDRITLPGIIYGLAAGSWLHGWADSLIGLLVGGGSFLLLAEVYQRTRGVQGMGGGDIKYIAAAGAFLGWQQVMVVIFGGSLLGALFGALGMSVKRIKFLTRIPFGPFLVLATLLSIFFGNELIDLYLEYAGMKQ